METRFVEDKFAQIGARLRLSAPPTNRFRRIATGISLDVRNDRKGEFFAINAPAANEAEVQVLDVQPADRHLLLLVRDNGEKHKYLCGHDERHWFVAAIPETAPVGTVRQAKEALKPVEVRRSEARHGLRRKAQSRRKNAAFVRQGEWFFLPDVQLTVNEKLVLRNEPLLRGNGGKPHWADFCFRTGGETVYVCFQHPNGVAAAEYHRIVSQNPGAKRWNWRTMRRNPGVYVRGRIRHADHRTIVLHGWHRVLMNTESQAKAMQHVAFLD